VISKQVKVGCSVCEYTWNQEDGVVVRLSLVGVI